MKTEYIMELLQRGGVITVEIPTLSRDRIKASINVPGGEWSKLTVPMTDSLVERGIIKLARRTVKGLSIKNEYILNKL